MRIRCFLFFLIQITVVLPQSKDTVWTMYSKPVEVIDSSFQKEYNRLKPKVVKVYPYALYAANSLDQLQSDLISIEKRRHKNRKAKISYKALKKDYKYLLQDMYVSEGQVLMKLISRETGKSVYSIIKSYKGVDDATLFSLFGKLFDQNIKVEYDPYKEYVLEYIINEIQEGKISINNGKPKTMSREEYKTQAKEEKINAKKAKKLKRIKKRESRKKKNLIPK